MEAVEHNDFREIVAEVDKRVVVHHDFLDPETAKQIRARTVIIQALEKAGLSCSTRRWLVFAQGDYARLLQVFKTESVLFAPIFQ